MIVLDSVRFSYGTGGSLLAGATLEVAPGEVVAVAGPNGSGKSTLLRIAAGLLSARAGKIELDGKPVGEWSRLRRAKALAYVPQDPIVPVDWPVGDLVALGDYPHREVPPAPLPLGLRLEEVKRVFALGPFWERKTGSLSGGEAQRVVLARAFVQAASNLVLDEPASHLDMAYRMTLYRALSEKAAEGRSVLLATHDINLSRLFGQRLVLLNGEGVVKAFPEEEGAQGALLQEAFGVRFLARKMAGVPCWFPDVTPFVHEGKGACGPDTTVPHPL